MELPRLQGNVQGDARNNLSGNKDRTSEVVFGNRFDGQCQEKSVISSACTGLRTPAEGMLADDDVYPGRDGNY
ncbi:MAG: hypothetical protein OXU36_16320 [Candidatus Poribacteria bacterium]|nr:hypothetical protein [Candidatus Poribacteria bacterium]